MKTMFQSKALHLAACILLFWKGISLLLCLLLRGAPTQVNEVPDPT